MSLLKQYREILKPDARVLNVYHKDLDGCASSIVVKNVFKNVHYKDVRYGFVNEYLEKVNYDNYDVVLLTDISPETAEPFSFSNKIFLLDHHDTAVAYNSPENNRIVIPGKSAAKLVKEFFENLFGLDMSYLNTFCEAVNDYDLWINNIPEGWMLNELYFKLWDENFRRRFKSGEIRFTPDETAYIKERKNLLNERFNGLDIYDSDIINGCFFFSTNFVNDLCHKLLKERGYDFVVCVNPKSKNCSVRINDKFGIHIGNILKEVDLGGGHAHAGGFVVERHEDVEDSINKVEKYLHINFPDIRK